MSRMPLDQKISPKHTALLIIDIQKDFASKDGILGTKRDFSLVPPMLESVKKLIQFSEKHGVLTLYTKQVYARAKLNAKQLEQYDLDGKLATCNIDGIGHEFFEINPPTKDVYIKYNFNAFSNADLVSTLESHNIKTVIITGMDIIFCIETAVRNAFDLGYKVVVPKDAIAGNAKRPELNEKSISMFAKFGVVTTTDEIISIWENTY